MEGIPSVLICGLPAIKLSDFDAKRAEFNLDNRDIVVMPDDTWNRYTLTATPHKFGEVTEDESPCQ
jgi:hypothetical protein